MSQIIPLRYIQKAILAARQFQDWFNKGWERSIAFKNTGATGPSVEVVLSGSGGGSCDCGCKDEIIEIAVPGMILFTSRKENHTEDNLTFEFLKQQFISGLAFKSEPFAYDMASFLKEFSREENRE